MRGRRKEAHFSKESAFFIEKVTLDVKIDLHFLSE